MIDPTVRSAEPGDVGQLGELERAARESLVDQRGGNRWLETHTERSHEWDQAIAAGRVWVAHIDAVVVGYLVVSFVDRLVRIDEVYVLPEARELGFGDALLEAAVDAGRRAGCESIEGEALPGDRDTKNLYERAGITARLIVVARRL